MKYKIIPVVLTAALTSVLTLFAVSHFQRQVPYFAAASNKPAMPVNYVSFGNSTVNSAPVNFENAAEASVKAVVHIKTATKARTVAANQGDMFSQLFGGGQYYIPSQIGSGSGVVISPDGYIVTNNHVVADANEVTVTFNDRATVQAKVIATDPSTDIAVLKVDDEKNLPFMEFGNSDEVKLGQWVLAVGYPLTLDATVTAGIVSAKGRSIGINKSQSATAIESFIQTDAAVNPGNSGGALVNTSGQLIGINSAIASPTGSYAGYSYAIPANIVRKAVNDLMKYGSVQRAYLGIFYNDTRTLTPEGLSSLGINKDINGLYITGFRPRSGAEKAGLKKGDLVTSINGEKVSSKPEVEEQIARYHPGDNITVGYNRNGKDYSATVQLTNMNGTTDIVKGIESTKILGATFRSLTDNEIANYNIDGGLLVTDIGKGTLAKQTQMRKGFVIISVSSGSNEMSVSSINDLQQILSENKNVQIAGFYPGNRGMYYYRLTNIDTNSGEE